MHLPKKLSPKTVAIAYGDKKIELAEGEDRKALYTVVGSATGYQVGEGNMGPYVAFKGRFRALGEGQKEFVESGTMFIPQPAQDMLKLALDELNSADGAPKGAKRTIEFALRVSIVANEKSNTGYEYLIENLIEPAPETDPLQRMLENLSGSGEVSLPSKGRGRKQLAEA